MDVRCIPFLGAARDDNNGALLVEALRQEPLPQLRVWVYSGELMPLCLVFGKPHITIHRLQRRRHFARVADGNRLVFAAVKNPYRSFPILWAKVRYGSSASYNLSMSGGTMSLKSGGTFRVPGGKMPPATGTTAANLPGYLAAAYHVPYPPTERPVR